jgi:hypothetical protein
LPLWRTAVGRQDAFAVLIPPLALLAGACWDAWRPVWARRAAATVVLVHAAVMLAGWRTLSDALPTGPAGEAAARTEEAA